MKIVSINLEITHALLHYLQVKNRESAARSRQRKAQYTEELEIELEGLKAQNRDLRMRILQLCPTEADTVDADGQHLH